MDEGVVSFEDIDPIDGETLRSVLADACAEEGCSATALTVLANSARPVSDRHPRQAPRR
jgi:hypothetical protein